MQDGIAALMAFRDSGISRVVTTPHLDGARATGTRRDRIESAFHELAAEARNSVPEVQFELAYEVRIDDPEADLSDRSLGLSDGGGILVEFSQLTLPAYSDRMLGVVVDQGWIPVLAHPERYSGIDMNYEWVGRWREMGAVMCLNVGSLLGEHGPEASRVAFRMLADGQADIIASDHHARPRRSTLLRRGWDLIAAGGSEAALEAARTLMISNPRALLSGDPLIPVIAFEPDGGWLGRLKRRLLG